MPLHGYQRFRVLDQQRSDKDRIHETVNCSIRANSKGQRQQRHCREHPVPEKRANGIPQIVQHDGLDALQR